MKLNEITQRPQQPTSGFSLSNFNIEGAKFVGTAENFPIYHIDSVDSKEEMYALKEKKEEKNFISMVIGITGSWFNTKTAFFIQRTYTDRKFRNRGLMTALYYALYTKLKLILVSDFEQSPETITIWKKLALTLPIKVLDLRNSEDIKLHNYKEFPQNELMDSEHIRLVLETLSPPPGLEGLDKYYNYNPDSIILEDYLVYTHPSKHGEYD